MKSLMIVGTTSHAGKSFLTTAICRLLARQGYRVTPFKGQNMALNAYVTDEGGEIGYAQAVQAWAAKISPKVAMNPILLKPQGDMTSQVIMQGKAVGITRAQEYYQDYFERGWQAITESLEALKKAYDVIVCEGAGSPAEINLKHRDLTNMRVAKYLQADTLLVVDIDRGGAFAHVVGTLQLLEPDEQALIKGIVINKFRGQRSLLDSGIEWLENYTGIPVLGVIPYAQNIFPAEDSLSLLERPSRPQQTDLEIAVIRLPRIANFTDFDPLDAEPNVYVKYVNLGESLGKPDAVILPGSKTTIADLKSLQASGMAQQLQNYVQQGGILFGICGGYQMLGQVVSDPEGLEGEPASLSGLGLLPIKTVITTEKITQQRQVKSAYPYPDLSVMGYEIHQGITEFLSEETQNYQALFQDQNLGIVTMDQQVWGCYLHGLFDNGPWRRVWLNYLRQNRGLEPLPIEIGNYPEQRDLLFDKMADFLAEHLTYIPSF